MTDLYTLAPVIGGSVVLLFGIAVTIWTEAGRLKDEKRRNEEARAAFNRENKVTTELRRDTNTGVTVGLPISSSVYGAPRTLVDAENS